MISYGYVPYKLLIINVLISLVYFSWWLNPSHIGQPLLYSLLLLGEVYHVLMALTFWQTLWPYKVPSLRQDLTKFSPWVDVFITVAGEQLDLVKQTALAAKNLDYKNVKVYLLNDGYLAQKDNWRQIEKLAEELEINCITRKVGAGAKAGNINNALKQTSAEIVAIFDADMKVSPDFLKKVLPIFKDKRVGFVQTPQYYENHQQNEVTKAAWQQQQFFFGPIMMGKDRQNSAIICGTNVALRRQALEEVGGMCEDNIAEDFLTSLFIHQKGWKSHYLGQVLAYGLAPQDLLSYYKQQQRWARGSLEVVFAHNPLFKTGLSLRQKLQYLSSAMFYFNGVVVAIDCLMPLIFLFTGITAVAAATTSFALLFIPFILVVFYTIYLSSAGTLTFPAISFAHSSFILQLSALKRLLFGEKSEFAITPKHKISGNFLFLTFPHLCYIILSLAAVSVALSREGLNPSVATNFAWTIFNVVMFIPFISASLKT